MWYNVIKETWGSNTLIPLYDLDSSVCGIKYNNTAYYFYKNLQGDVIAITDASGTVIARYVYDAWGRVLQVTDAHCNSVANDSAHIANINPFRYRGYYYDQETQLYYLQSRYYDPKVGRFINADVPEIIVNESKMTPNLFTYCGNSPVKQYDVLGFLGIGDLLGVLNDALSFIIASIKTLIASACKEYINLGEQIKNLSKSGTKKQRKALIVKQKALLGKNVGNGLNLMARLLGLVTVVLPYIMYIMTWGSERFYFWELIAMVVADCVCALFLKAVDLLAKWVMAAYFLLWWGVSWVISQLLSWYFTDSKISRMAKYYDKNSSNFVSNPVAYLFSGIMA